jgi:ATP-binding protein involved in chromosome partitioning
MAFPKPQHELVRPMITQEKIQSALKEVKYPGYSRDIVSFGLVKQISIEQGKVGVLIELGSAAAEIAREIQTRSEAVLRALPEARDVQVEVRMPAPSPAAGGGMAQQPSALGIRRIVAVASGKGGVGKSTTSVNLACALHQLGLKTGLMDCDIYGPSVPLMMGTHERPSVSKEEKLVPPLAHGVKLMSMGFLLEGDSPVIWRGPMIMKTIQQFVSSVDWGELDYLIVDLPPGTGDAQLSLCQTVPLDGGVIVTTPQEASLGVVRKGIAMFQKVNVPILGLVENMSYFVTPGGERFEIFGHGGGKAEAERQRVPFLGEVPIYTAIRESGDRGVPVVVSDPQGAPAQAFMRIVKVLAERLP